MKIVVVGLGYVGLSNAVLLSQKYEVVGVDQSHDRVALLNKRVSPIEDPELSDFLLHERLNLSATVDLEAALEKSDFAIVATPTNYDVKTDYFDTSTVESVIEQIISTSPETVIIIKSTIPIGFVDFARAKFGTDNIIFSPEFLREGRALYDNLHPSRIVVGGKCQLAVNFASLLKSCARSQDVEVMYTDTKEAESIKLFSNSYLAMRVAFFNELDTYCIAKDLNSGEIVRGISADPRIGNMYNNPSFGYGGYCLPKDTKQLLANYNEVPQRLMTAIVESNATRKKFIAEQIMATGCKIIGAFRLSMKAGSDNSRESSVTDIISTLTKNGLRVIIYEPSLQNATLGELKVEQCLSEFVDQCDLIIANRMEAELLPYKHKVYTRDLSGSDL